MEKVDCVICGNKVYLNPFNLKTYDNNNGIYDIHRCCKEVIDFDNKLLIQSNGVDGK